MDLSGEAIERHTRPSEEGAYRRVGRGQVLRSEVLSDLVVPVDAVLA